MQHVERRLCACWANHQQLKGFNLHDIFVVPFTLRRRMLYFVQNLIYYMTVEVLEPTWHVMESKLQKVVLFLQSSFSLRLLSGLAETHSLLLAESQGL